MAQRPQKTDLTVLPAQAEAAGMSLDVWSTLNASLFPGARMESIIAAYRYCKARKLDVLKKPVHIVPMSVKNQATNQYESIDVIMPGIYELRTTASRTNAMAGTDAPVYGPTINVLLRKKATAEDAATIEAPEFCSITVHRLDANGVPRSYTHVEYFVEAVARDKEGRINSMWEKRPRGQLAKCAEAGALRKAFPDEIGGEYTSDEMVGKTIDGDEINGEFTVVSASDIPEPETRPAQEAPPAAAAESETPVEPGTTKEAPAGASGEGNAPNPPKQEPAKAPPPQASPTSPTASGSAGYTAESEPSKEIKIDLPTGAYNLLKKKLANAGLTEADLRAGFTKDIVVVSVNEAFTWISENAKNKA